MAEVIPLIVNTTAGAAPTKQMAATDTVPRANMSVPNVISPSQITSDQDDYAPTGYGAADVIRLNLDTGFRAITGLNSSAAFDGEQKTFVNTTGNYGYLPSEHPDSTAAYRFAGEIDHIIGPYCTIRIQRDDTSSRWRVIYNSFIVSELGIFGKGLFFNQMPGSTNQSDHSFLGLAVSGTGADNQNDASTTSLPAAWGLTTGTTNAGVSTLYLIKNAPSTTAFGAAHLCAWALIYIPTLSTSAQRFMTRFAITASPSGTTVANNAIEIRHDDNTNSGKWLVASRDNAGAETTADSGITVVANTLYMLRIWIDKGRSEARFSITDGTNSYRGRITGNMPNAVVCGVRVATIKSVGTTSRTLNVAQIGHFAIY